MPREQMDSRQVADYLHMDMRAVDKLASRGQIPCRKVGGTFIFLKGELDHWVEARMHTLGPKELAKIHKGVSRHHGFDHEEMLIAPLLPDAPHGIAVPLGARTREAVLRALVDLAEKAHLVYNREDLLREIREREDLCTTAIVPGVAMPHPRHPLPYDIAESFVVAGMTTSGIPFGADDGSLTRLFFLICCKDDRTHLHVLARLAHLLHEQTEIEELLHAGSPDELRELLVSGERALLRK